MHVIFYSPCQYYREEASSRGTQTDFALFWTFGSHFILVLSRCEPRVTVFCLNSRGLYTFQYSILFSGVVWVNILREISENVCEFLLAIFTISFGKVSNYAMRYIGFFSYMFFLIFEAGKHFVGCLNSFLFPGRRQVLSLYVLIYPDAMQNRYAIRRQCNTQETG